MIFDAKINLVDISLVGQFDFFVKKFGEEIFACVRFEVRGSRNRRIKDQGIEEEKEKEKEKEKEEE